MDLRCNLLLDSIISLLNPSLPSESQASLVLLQSSASSFGSIENSLSGPLSFLLSVKCFSITHAPRATDATDIVVPKE